MFNSHIKFEMSTITCNEEMKVTPNVKILVLGVTYMVHIWLVGKRVVDCLLVLIELYSLALMAAALLSEICRNRRFYPRGASDAQVIAIIVCLCVCVSLSVCHTLVLHQNGQNVGSCKQCHVIAEGF